MISDCSAICSPLRAAEGTTNSQHCSDKSSLSLTFNAMSSTGLPSNWLPASPAMLHFGAALLPPPIHLLRSERLLAFLVLYHPNYASTTFCGPQKQSVRPTLPPERLRPQAPSQEDQSLIFCGDPKVAGSCHCSVGFSETTQLPQLLQQLAPSLLLPSREGK